MLKLVLALLALLAAPSALAATVPLTLGEVLESSRRHAPQVLEAVARARAAEGRVLAAEGAFDTMLSAETLGRAGGSYNGGVVEATVSRPITDWGGSLYSGYRLSGGVFAPYDAGLAAGGLGEFKVGAVFALLRDRAIDERRFSRVYARLDVEIAELDRLMVAISVQRRAVAAYNAWVAAGLRLRIYEDLLKLAHERQQALVRQVDLGARARIILTENEQAILRRQTLVTRSQQELTNAAIQLSFFLRDADGRPSKPAAERLPASLAPIPFAPETARLSEARPDLRLIDVRISQAQRRLELDQNSLLPRLDLRMEASQDLGGGLPAAFGPRNTEVSVGLRFSLPLQQRTASGRIATTGAEIEAARRRRQTLEEQIMVDLERLATDVKATAEIQRLAEAERDRAVEMAAAERRRFEGGASDYFLVNLREEAAADADVRRLEAVYRQIDARAELAAAAMDLSALGLDTRRDL